MTENLKLEPARWVERHGDGLYRYAYARVRNPEAAAELVQETFLDALRARGSFSGRSSERTWLIAILKHKVADFARRSKRERTLGAGESLEGAADGPFDRWGHWKRPPKDWPSDPLAEYERREFWDVLGSCLTRLPAHLADAFLDHELEGVTREQICERAQITPANLATRLYRARLLLRDCLDAHWFAPAQAVAAGPRVTPAEGLTA
ncbi:MAG: sigma-70 family RNA polymerase sigma factor [Isosphaeraceae bacterium]|nr:sigma-70 family RNA polymerase sigma factor [Isosphaeraceae bacterium]